MFSPAFPGHPGILENGLFKGMPSAHDIRQSSSTPHSIGNRNEIVRRRRSTVIDFSLILKSEVRAHLVKRCAVDITPGESPMRVRCAARGAIVERYDAAITCYSRSLLPHDSSYRYDVFLECSCGSGRIRPQVTSRRLDRLRRWFADELEVELGGRPRFSLGWTHCSNLGRRARQRFLTTRHACFGHDLNRQKIGFNRLFKLLKSLFCQRKQSGQPGLLRRNELYRCENGHARSP